MAEAKEPTDHHLDASFPEFETPPSLMSPRQSSVLPSEPATEEDLMEDLDVASVGGYSPPAWRRLGNGDLSSGFWRGPHDVFSPVPMRPIKRCRQLLSDDDDNDDDDDYDESDADDVLQKAIRTRLPTGSMSPVRDRSLSPVKRASAGRTRSRTLRIQAPLPKPMQLARVEEKQQQQQQQQQPQPQQSHNYIRFAVRAEVQQRTEPIESAMAFVRKRYASMTATWSSTVLSLVIAILGISTLKALFQAPAPRPAGDLVKVAGIARSFEPLIYYSEHAVTQVHDLQATSVAVWDLGESVRTSGMRDAETIVADLDALSTAMKTLATEMTKFFAVVDGDIDGILNVMDWAKMHLNRLQNAPPPSSLSSAYDNIHNMLSEAHILEDASGTPTTLGTLATYIFGLSNPQREQRMVQLLFNEFLSILEDSVREELRYSMALYGLFNTIDQRFLNLARTVARESSAQEELHSDMLASLWVRILGTRAAELRKFEQNRVLLRDVRDKTVRNKGILVNHHSKLLSLQTSLEGLRTRLISPLVRGANASILTLEDQIDGLSGVRDHLAEIRRLQKGKVMESLFASAPSKQRHALLDDPRVASSMSELD